MEPIQIVLVVLALVGVWAVAELALTLRRTRDVVASLDKTVEQVNSTIEEARPVVAKLVSGAASSASNAVTEFADAASGKVQRLLNRGHKAAAPKAVKPAPVHDDEPVAQSAVQPAKAPASEAESQAEPRTYFTYNPGEETINE